jgi:hypothetical protein
MTPLFPDDLIECLDSSHFLFSLTYHALDFDSYLASFNILSQINQSCARFYVRLALLQSGILLHYNL